MNLYFQPRNFRHALTENEGCAESISLKPVTRFGIGIAVGIGVGGWLGVGAGLAAASASLGIGMTINNLVNPAGYGTDGNPTYYNRLRKDQYNANGGIANIPTYGSAVQNAINGGSLVSRPLAPASAPVVKSPAASQPGASQSPAPASGISVTEEMAIMLGVIALGAALFVHRKGKK